MAAHGERTTSEVDEGGDTEGDRHTASCTLIGGEDEGCQCCDKGRGRCQREPWQQFSHLSVDRGKQCTGERQSKPPEHGPEHDAQQRKPDGQTQHDMARLQ
jgi:hypothetical protein